MNISVSQSLIKKPPRATAVTVAPTKNRARPQTSLKPDLPHCEAQPQTDHRVTTGLASCSVRGAGTHPPLALCERRKNRSFHQRKWEDDGSSVWGHYFWGGLHFFIESYCNLWSINDMAMARNEHGFHNPQAQALWTLIQTPSCCQIATSLPARTLKCQMRAKFGSNILLW